MSSLEAVLGIVMLVGLVGVVVPVFPGLILVIVAGFVWALQRGGSGAWAVFAIIAAVGIWKGLPWGRVLYVVWNVIGIAVSFYTSPQQAMIFVSILIFVVIAGFLFTNRANEWFQARGLALSREPAR